MLSNLYTALIKSIFWGISRNTIIHMNVFVAYLLMQELIIDKIYFFNKARLKQLKSTGEMREIIWILCADNMCKVSPA